MRKFFYSKNTAVKKLRIVVTNYAIVFRYQKPGRLGAVLVIGLDWEHIGGAQNLPVIAQPVPTDLAAGLPAGKFAGTVGEMESRLH